MELPNVSVRDIEDAAAAAVAADRNKDEFNSDTVGMVICDGMRSHRGRISDGMFIYDGRMFLAYNDQSFIFVDGVPDLRRPYKTIDPFQVVLQVKIIV